MGSSKSFNVNRRRGLALFSANPSSCMCPGNPQNFFKGGFAFQEFFDSILPEGVNAFLYGLGAQRFRIRFCLDQFSD